MILPRKITMKAIMIKAAIIMIMATEHDVYHRERSAQRRTEKN
jgi:hypothetical protein